MNVHDPEALVQCPYDKVHMIRRKRMPYHLQKCRRNFAGRAFKVCPFNARHEVPEPEYQHHLVNCPNKSLVERDMIHMKRLHEDASYREKYENGFSSSFAAHGNDDSSGVNEWDEDGDGDGAWPAEREDRLIESFNRQVALDDDDDGDDNGSPTTNLPSNRQLSIAERRRRQQQLLHEKRSGRATEDHGNNSSNTSDYGSDGQTDVIRTTDLRPKTRPLALKMIRSFGRGSNVDFTSVEIGGGGGGLKESGESGGGVSSDNGVENGGAQDDFGMRFPPSLGRGTIVGGGRGIKFQSAVSGSSGQDWDDDEDCDAAKDISSYEYEKIHTGQFEDSAVDHSQTHDRWREEEYPALVAQRGQMRTMAQQRQLQNQRDNLQNLQSNIQNQPPENQQISKPQWQRVCDEWEPGYRQHGYADFPEMQKGIKPRYNSTFGADRPLSKQAQIQLAQQQQQQQQKNTQRDTANWKKRRGRGVGRGFSRKPEEPKPIQGFNDVENLTSRFALGRGVIVEGDDHF